MPSKLQSICVFTGSNHGRLEVYGDMAAVLGTMLAQRGLRLVYGGAKVGLMGRVADACLAAGGLVTGIIPQSLIDKEIAHTGLSDMHVVNSMHERKAMMADLSDGFIAMPGGAGTLEEMFEVWTWGQLGHHTKPVGLLNVAGYYDLLCQFLDHIVVEEFFRPQHRDMLLVEEHPEALLTAFDNYVPPVVTKWIGRSQV